jgi:hypothetical protein
MSWGWKITTVYVTFVIGILTLVFKARSERVDLVSTDYYAQELAYSQRLEAQRNTATLSAVPYAVLNDDGVDIMLPSECFAATELKLHVYCPSNAANDRIYTLEPKPRQQLSTSEWMNGIYIMKWSFRIGDKNYYYEQAIDKK